MMVKQFQMPLWILTFGSIALFVGAVALNGAMLQRRIRGTPVLAR